MATGLPHNRLGIITDVQDPSPQQPLHQEQPIFVKTEQWTPPTSATHDSDAAIAKNSLLDWPVLEGKSHRNSGLGTSQVANKHQVIDMI